MITECWSPQSNHRDTFFSIYLVKQVLILAISFITGYSRLGVKYFLQHLYVVVFKYIQNIFVFVIKIHWKCISKTIIQYSWHPLICLLVKIIPRFLSILASSVLVERLFRMQVTFSSWKKSSNRQYVWYSYVCNV